MNRFFAVVLAILALLFACPAYAQTVSVVYEDGQLQVYLQHVEEETEEKVAQYIEEFNLNEECKAVILNYTPDVNSFDRIEREALAAYRIIMKDGSVYLLSVNKDSVPMCLQSAEEDYKLRTRYYDKFAK